MLVNNVVQMIEWERDIDPENKQSVISEEIFDVDLTSNHLVISNFQKDQSHSDLNKNSSQKREKIDDFVDEMINNSSVSFLKDQNQDKL